MNDELKKQALAMIASTLRDFVGEAKERPTKEAMASLAEDMAAALVAADKKLSSAT